MKLQRQKFFFGLCVLLCDLKNIYNKSLLCRFSVLLKLSHLCFHKYEPQSVPKDGRFLHRGTKRTRRGGKGRGSWSVAGNFNMTSNSSPWGHFLTNENFPYLQLFVLCTVRYCFNVCDREHTWDLYASLDIILHWYIS